MEVAGCISTTSCSTDDLVLAVDPELKVVVSKRGFTHSQDGVQAVPGCPCSISLVASRPASSSWSADGVIKVSAPDSSSHHTTNDDECLVSSSAARNDMCLGKAIVTCPARDRRSIVAWTQDSQQDSSVLFSTILAEDLPGDIRALSVSNGNEWLAAAIKTPDNDSSDEPTSSSSTGDIWILRLDWDSGSISAIDHFATVAADVAASTAIKFVHLNSTTLLLLSVCSRNCEARVKLMSFVTETTSDDNLDNLNNSDAVVVEGAVSLGPHALTATQCCVFREGSEASSAPVIIVAVGTSNGDVHLLDLCVQSGKVKMIGTCSVTSSMSKAVNSGQTKSPYNDITRPKVINATLRRKSIKSNEKPKQAVKSSIYVTLSASGTDEPTENNVEFVEGSRVEMSCEVISLAFVSGSCDVEENNNHDLNESSNSPDKSTLLLVVGTAFGLAAVDVRTRRIVSVVTFADMANCAEITNCDNLASSVVLQQHNNSRRLSCAATFDCTMVSFELRMDPEMWRRRTTSSISIVATAPLPRNSFLLTKFDYPVPKEKEAASARMSARSSGYGRSNDPPRKMFQPRVNKSRAKSGDPIGKIHVEASNLSNSTESASRGRWQKVLSSKLTLPNTLVSAHLGPPTRLAWSSPIWTTSGARVHVAASTATASAHDVVAAAGPDNVVEIFKCRNIRQSNRLSMDAHLSLSVGHGLRIVSLDVSHSGSMVLAATDDHTVAVFDCDKNKASREPRLRIGDEGHISSSSRNILRSTVYGSSSSSSSKSATSPKPFSFGAVISRAQFFFLDQFVLSASENRVFAHSIDTQEWTCKLKKVFTFSDCHSVPTLSAANAFPSYLAVVACSDRRLRVLDLAAESVVAVLNNAGVVNAVAQPVDGNHRVLASVAAVDGAKIWDLRLRDPVQHLDWPGSSSSSRLPCGLAMSPCGGLVASGTASAAYVFDLRRAGAFVRAFESRSPVTDVRFVRDASCLATATHHGRLNIYTV